MKILGLTALLGAIAFSTSVCGCDRLMGLGETFSVLPSNEATRVPESPAPLWRGEFSEHWRARWQVRSQGAWGEDNIQIISDPTERFDQILRVHYPAGSASPSVSREAGAPLGGAQFYADLGIEPQDSLRLSYYVRFSEDFEFVKGGKLPGLFGGDGANGGHIPNGINGFSARLMWRRQGDGEVYAYLPTSEEHGTSIGRGNWRFRRGVWHHIEQEIKLNQPEQADGRIRLWFDSVLVLDEDGLRFRAVDTLRLNGLFFSTFFGGGDPSWATPTAVYADFAEFMIFPGQR